MLFRSNYPDGKVTVITSLKGPAGDFHPAEPLDAMSAFCFSATTPHAARLMELCDYMLSEEGTTLLRYGIEGIHYTKNGSEIVQNQAEYDADVKPQGDVWGGGGNPHSISSITSYDYTRWYPLTLKRRDAIVDIYDRAHVNPIRSLVAVYSSETLVNAAPKIKDTRNEYFARMISGDLDIETGWEQYLEAMSKAGYYEIEQEVNDYMASR